MKYRIYDTEDRCYVEEPDFRWMLSRKGKLYNSENDEWHNVGEMYFVEFFTGLTDKNGEDIYENDICKFFNPYSKQWYVGLIKYHIGAFGFHKSLDDKYGFEWDFLAIQELEVIGNIHDNPELLTEK